MNWQKAKGQGIVGAWLRATVGNYYVDTQLYRNADECDRLSIPYGVYVVMVPTIPVYAHQYWLAEAMDALDPLLPYVVDAEIKCGTPDEAIEVTVGLLQEILTWDKRTPLLYTSPSYACEWLKNDRRLASYPLWIANYQVTKPTMPAPWSEWEFWQYSADGNNEGANYGTQSDDVDLDWYNGTAEKFNETYLGITPPPTNVITLKPGEEVIVRAG